MSDLERKLEDLYMSDSRARRVGRVTIDAQRRNPLGPAAFIGAIALAALAAIVAVNTLRPSSEQPAAIGSPSSAAGSAPATTPTNGPSPSAGLRPDAHHGLITFQNIRSEADPRDLQQPPSFVRDGRSDFKAAVSPDGARVAVIRYGQTGVQLITFTTARPNDVTALYDFSGTGLTVGDIIWAGDSSDYIVLSVDQSARVITYSELWSFDIAARKPSAIARITSGLHLVPLAWRFDTHVGGAIEIDASTGRVASYDVIRDNSLTDRTPIPSLRGGENPSGPFSTQFSASRDGRRVVGVFAPAVRWWPVDQPAAFKELLANSEGRAEYAEFRPGTGELGVRVVGPTTSLGVPPPGHFEIWSLAGPQRIVSPTAGFTRWRVDGTAALDATNLIDPASGAVTPLPGGAFKIVDVVLF